MAFSLIPGAEVEDGGYFIGGEEGEGFWGKVGKPTGAEDEVWGEGWGGDGAEVESMGNGDEGWGAEDFFDDGGWEFFSDGGLDEEGEVWGGGFLGGHVSCLQ